MLKRDINVVLFPMLLSISKDWEETETSRTKCCTVLAAHRALPSSEDQGMLRNERQRREMVMIWMTSLLGADWNYIRGRINLGFLVRSCPTDQQHYIQHVRSMMTTGTTNGTTFERITTQILMDTTTAGSTKSNMTSPHIHVPRTNSTRA